MHLKEMNSIVLWTGGGLCEKLEQRPNGENYPVNQAQSRRSKKYSLYG